VETVLVTSGDTAQVVCDPGFVAVGGGGNARVGTGGGNVEALFPIFVPLTSVGPNNTVTGPVSPAIDGSAPNGWQLNRTSNGSPDLQVWVTCVPGTPNNTSNGS
jgi:hypothetical protein